jgi:hypothetical protein
MTQPTNTLVSAADYADALIVARRVKTTLCVLLFFVLGATLTLFALLRYVPSMQSLTDYPPPAADTTGGYERALLQYLVGLLDFAGLVLPALLVAIVVVLLLVQVVARVVGAGRSVSAFAWAVLLAVLLFPWQAVLNNPVNTVDPTASAIGMKVPGAIYTWAELSHPTLGAHFAEVNAPGGDKVMAVLHWARFAAFPLLAMIIVGVVHTKTERGLRQSFGTDVVVLPPADEVVAVTATPQL